MKGKRVSSDLEKIKWLYDRRLAWLYHQRTRELEDQLFFLMRVDGLFGKNTARMDIDLFPYMKAAEKFIIDSRKRK